MSTNFVEKKKLAADTFAVTPAKLIKHYLMNAVLDRSLHTESLRSKAKKSASGRYVPFTGAIEFSFKVTSNTTVMKKRSRYMAGRLNELTPVDQVREVTFVATGEGLQYSFFVDLKDDTGNEVSTMVTSKTVTTFFHPKLHNKIDQELLDAVAADMFSFLYSQRPEEKVMKELRLQKPAQAA